jgi:hypothetical protein
LVSRVGSKAYARHQDVLEYLGDGDSIQVAITDYFINIHPWMPIVSKKRMNMGLPLFDGGPDLAVLFLAMKLVTSKPTDGVAMGEYYLYTAAKRFLSLLESCGSISVMNLQALILVALYEYSHAIYPAAWMTVGACVKYVDLLGLPSYKSSCEILGQCVRCLDPLPLHIPLPQALASEGGLPLKNE